MSGLTDGELSFSSGAERQTFTVTANEDADTVDEEVTLGFGTPLPEGVSAGDPARATVTLFDNDPPGDDPEGPVGTPGEVRLSTTTPQVGRELTATLVDEDGYLRDISWRWERRSGPGSAWRDIEPPDDRTPHTDLSRYRPSSSDEGQQLRATVSYTDGHGPGKSAQSAETDPVQRPDRQGTVRLSTTTPQVGRELTATLVDEDGYLRDISWRWERRSGPGSAWRDIEPPDDRTPHTDLSRYRPSSSDEGQQLRATVSYTDGHGPDKSAQSAETDPVGNVPSAPRNFSASAGNGQVSLSWNPPASDGGSAITRYEHRRRSGGSWSGWTGVGTRTSATVSGLSNGTRYSFEVRAVNRSGDGAAASAGATPCARPAAPTVTVSVPPQPGTLYVNWTEPDDNGCSITGYEVEYCYFPFRDDGDPPSENSPNDSDPSAGDDDAARIGICSSTSLGNSASNTTLTGLRSNTSYGVKVRAGNSKGTGPWSGERSATTRSAAAKALAEQMALTGLEGLAALAAPNPFNPSTTLYFQVPESEEVSLVIYSLAGQVVKTLIPNRTLKAGIHEVYWAGRDQQGRPAAAGVYFYRLTAGNKSLVQKMTLLR